MKYFLVTCHRGHCGTGHSTSITFAFCAKNLLEAVSMGKRMPSVKHTRMILEGKEISYEAYTEYRRINAYQRATGCYR